MRLKIISNVYWLRVQWIFYEPEIILVLNTRTRTHRVFETILIVLLYNLNFVLAVCRFVLLSKRIEYSRIYFANVR